MLNDFFNKFNKIKVKDMQIYSLEIIFIYVVVYRKFCF